MNRAETIAGALRRPDLQRWPVLGHELSECLVQGLGPRSSLVEWTATVPQLARVIDTALSAGHALVVECHGLDVVGTCQCGRRLGRIRPGTPLDALAVPWERHTSSALAATA